MKTDEDVKQTAAGLYATFTKNFEYFTVGFTDIQKGQIHNCVLYDLLVQTMKNIHNLRKGDLPVAVVHQLFADMKSSTMKSIGMKEDLEIVKEGEKDE